MMDEITYRWIDGPTASNADWERVEKILAARGWMSLNRQTSRILLAERGGSNESEVGFFVFQFIPSCGPMYVPRSMRGTGVAETLADKMDEFLSDSKARGFIVVADNPIAAKMCEARGLHRIPSPIYTTEDAYASAPSHGRVS